MCTKSRKWDCSADFSLYIPHCQVMWKSEALVQCLFYFPLGTKTTILIEGIIRASYHWFQQQSKREEVRVLVLEYRTVILACFAGISLREDFSCSEGQSYWEIGIHIYNKKAVNLARESTKNQLQALGGT